MIHVHMFPKFASATKMFLRSSTSLISLPQRVQFGIPRIQELCFSSSPLAAAKKRSPLPSKWEDVAEKANLPNDYKMLQTLLPDSKVPLCRLPPSLHKVLAKAAWLSLDVYTEPSRQTREEPHTRVLEQVCTPIALFKSLVLITRSILFLL
jgi:hypothetical protein